MAALNLKGVKKTYDGTNYVLHGIDVAIEDGEFVVMVGPSGCGKSTLLRMVAGLESVSDGAIEIGGKVVNKLEPKDRDIAMVFQNYALYPHMSVAQNMAYALRIGGFEKKIIEERVTNAARILELEHLLARKPRELSGGQRQRVAMGRAIVREPAVFLFDEPLSNLDAKLRVQMRLEIQRLHARLATTSLYVTHDQIEAMTLAQRVIVMNKGHAEQIGAPTEVYERPATVFVASFIGSPAMNLLEGRVSEDGSAFVVAGDGPSLPLSGVSSALHGREWIIGIRPEHMTPGADAAASVTLDVDSAELLGADNLAHGKWGKHDVAARLPHEHRPQRGERLSVSLPARHLHFFDPSTGLRAN
ncbi:MULTISPECIES: sn-glycerol-3-phosphate import ATP-binding protein UgpC [Caballeronia]|uniref:sn-glycerol-3-phosphate import ATP-binding protein UgpC n=1 Tax=Caballeronia TaxID=1827195 RepID=UPI00045EFD7D|nr:MULTISPECIES: sn-glycerol-3-phosphate import ATP-binding protein UgpC [unclassified Caballeronia]MCE4543617.1 sn-glycerol-3-phosphate import ATP-binding protein UgpC [Caballeronia sp. PC1]MCE4567326.1 sn-glycerol-3-phosphate import ATP-binding protein UgpC [Caballeronia sp. CLC5]BAO87532.1 ABC transporter like protein [Burkholderia sp. RPE67]BBP97459.1 sn-glycerol-3-phosphate import ATP-binding protein UgpC [Burkholderia sp. SFA1]